MKAFTIAATELCDYLDFPFVATVFTVDKQFYVGPFTTREEAQCWVDAARELATWQVSVNETAREAKRAELKAQGLSGLKLSDAVEAAFRQPATVVHPADDYDTDQE